MPLPEEEDKEYISYSVVDGRTGMLLSVVMVCGCGSPVVALPNGKFYCEHCDRGCSTRPCQFCEAHFLFDAEAVKSEYREYYEEDEDEEDW